MRPITESEPKPTKAIFMASVTQNPVSKKIKSTVTPQIRYCDLPSGIKKWEEGMKKWPWITYTSMFSYFIFSDATDSEAMKALWYISVVTSTVIRSDIFFFKEVEHKLLYLKADIEPTQSIKFSITGPEVELQ